MACSFPIWFKNCQQVSLVKCVFLNNILILSLFRGCDNDGRITRLVAEFKRVKENAYTVFFSFHYMHQIGN